MDNQNKKVRHIYNSFEYVLYFGYFTPIKMDLQDRKKIIKVD